MVNSCRILYGYISEADVTSFFLPNQEAASISDEHERFPVGSKVQAVWSEDGEWYDLNMERFEI